MMTNQNKLLLLLLFLCICCFPAGAQLSFKIDSLSCFCYGSFGYETSWENKELYQRGPDILVYGILTNNSDSPIILELTEYRRDTLLFHRELCLLFSYHYTKDYRFTQDPLITSDYFSFPYWKEKGLPSYLIRINEKDLSYSIIRAGESIPLAFESLSIPRSETELISINPPKSYAYKRRLRFQKRLSKAIKASLKITPVLNDNFDSHELYEQFLSYLSSQSTEESQYDFESSIPQYLIETKPIFIDGGLDGFCKWLRVELGEFQTAFPGQESRIMLVFVVDKKGEIVYTKMTNSIPNENNRLEKLLKEIILQSPKWIPGEHHGERVDTRITLMLTIDHNGRVKDISIR